MYLEAELGLGAQAPAAIQQLNPGTAMAVMTYLGDKYLQLDATQPPGGGAFNYIALRGSDLAAQGIQLEGKLTAAQEIQALPSGQYALVHTDEVQAIVTNQWTGALRVTSAPAEAAAQLATGQDLTILWPLGTSVASPTPKKSMAAPIIGAVIGAGGGALVGGGVGAIVGGVAGYLVGNAVA